MLIDEIRDNLLAATERLAERGRDEIRQQGHVASGRGLSSVEAFLEVGGRADLAAVIVANDYMVGPVDTGVPAGRIPFSGTGGGGTSDYIQGLLEWIGIVQPGLDDEEALGFAIAIAYTHAKEGNPSNGSFAFSQNGRRTQWIENGLALSPDKIERDLKVGPIIDKAFTRAVLNAAK